MLKKETRDSNIEILRIFSMIMIVFYHCFHQIRFYTLDDLNVNYLYTVMHNGVPLFLLISGYFTITLNLKKMMDFYLYCVLWGIIPFVLAVMFNNETFEFRVLIKQFLPFSHPNVWYPKFYFWLMLLAPFLNLSFKNLSLKRHAILVLILYISVVYFGCLWHDPIVAGGKSIIYFILMYSIGGILRRFYERIEFNNKFLNFIFKTLNSVRLCILLLSLYFIITYVILNVIPEPYNKLVRGIIGAYQGPLLPLTSILIFCVFKKIKIRSRVINNVAASMFSIYLFHENKFSNFMFRDRVTEIFIKNDGFEFILYLIILVLSLFVIVFILDNIIRKPIQTYIMKFVCRYIQE